MLFYKTWMDLALDSCFLLESHIGQSTVFLEGLLATTWGNNSVSAPPAENPLGSHLPLANKCGDGEPDLHGCTKSKTLACKSLGSGPLCQPSTPGAWPPKPVSSRSFCACDMHIVMTKSNGLLVCMLLELRQVVFTLCMTLCWETKCPAMLIWDLAWILHVAWEWLGPDPGVLLALLLKETLKGGLSSGMGVKGAQLQDSGIKSYIWVSILHWNQF